MFLFIFLHVGPRKCHQRQEYAASKSRPDERKWSCPISDPKHNQSQIPNCHHGIDDKTDFVIHDNHLLLVCVIHFDCGNGGVSNRKPWQTVPRSIWSGCNTWGKCCLYCTKWQCRANNVLHNCPLRKCHTKYPKYIIGTPNNTNNIIYCLPSNRVIRRHLLRGPVRKNKAKLVDLIPVRHSSRKGYFVARSSTPPHYPLIQWAYHSM